MLDILCLRYNPVRFSKQIISLSATGYNSTYTNLNIIRSGTVVDNTKKYATLEPQGWRLDGTYSLYDGEKFAFWGSTAAASSGNLSNNSITIRFATEISMLEMGGIVVIADPTTPIIGIQCTLYNDTTQVASYTSTANNSYIWLRQFEEIANKTVTRVVIQFTKTKPGRRMKIKNILFGKAMAISDDNFYNVKTVEEISIASDRIPANTLSFTLSADQGYIDTLQRNYKYVTLLKDGVQYGGYYLDSIEKENDNKFTVTSIDVIGLLETLPYQDNMFISVSGNSVTINTVLSSIMTDVDCYYNLIDIGSSAISIKFQSLSKRDALTQLLLVSNLVCKKLRNGNLVFRKLDTSTVIKDITSDIYTGYKVIDNVPVSSISMSKFTNTKGDPITGTSPIIPDLNIAERGYNYVIFRGQLSDNIWAPTCSSYFSYFVSFVDKYGEFGIRSNISTEDLPDNFSIGSNYIEIRLDTNALLGERPHYERSSSGKWLYRGTRYAEWSDRHSSIKSRIQRADWSTLTIHSSQAAITYADAVTLGSSPLVSTVTNPNELNALKTQDLQIQTVQIADLVIDGGTELGETTETSKVPIIDDQGQDTGQTETVTNVVPINNILPKMMDRYYQYPKVLDAKILSEGLQCGDTVSVTLPYIGDTTGTIQKLESSFVNKEISSAQILLYYTG